MRGRLLLALLAVITIAPRASRPREMIPAQAFEPMLLAPVVVTVLAIIPLYRWLLPSQLGSLQVAFETQDDLYEVHRLTRGRRSARDLFSLPGVPFSMVEHVMAMAGILLLIGELIFDPSSFFEPLILVMFVLIGAPVLISPYETLNGQLTGRGREGTAIRSAGHPHSSSRDPHVASRGHRRSGHPRSSVRRLADT